MTFHDLPDARPAAPLTDPTRIADALDALIPWRDRARGALLVLLCDDERRPIQPVLVDALDSLPSTEMPRMLQQLAFSVAHTAPGLSAFVAFARPGPLEVTPTDEMWRRSIVAAFDGQVPVFGIHLVTRTGSMPLAALDAAA